jgi:hypothetical protein
MGANACQHWHRSPPVSAILSPPVADPLIEAIVPEGFVDGIEAAVFSERLRIRFHRRFGRKSLLQSIIL